MSGRWGQNLRVSIFGESHGAGIGIVIAGAKRDVYHEERGGCA